MHATIRLLSTALFTGVLAACGTTTSTPIESAAAQDPQPGGGRGPMGDGRGGEPGPRSGHLNFRCTFASGELTDRVLVGVREAIADEWTAEEQYEAFSTRIGPPFPRLERAEARHADLLVQLLSAHGHLPPQRPQVAPAEAATAEGACAAALSTERENFAMYARLLADEPPQDVRCVYEHLQAISAERHIPALERCGSARP